MFVNGKYFVIFASKPLGFGLPMAISLVSAIIITLLASFNFYNKALKVSNVNNIKKDWNLNYKFISPILKVLYYVDTDEHLLKICTFENFVS